MIRTKDLVEWTRKVKVMNRDYHLGEDMGYRAEIVARLRAFDKLKEALEKMIAQIGGK